MVNCAVISCTNSTLSKTNRYNGKFKQIPKDKNGYEEWMKLCGRTPETFGTRAQICEEHFTLTERHSYYCRRFNPGQKEPCRCHIHKQAVPSLKLPDEEAIQNWNMSKKNFAKQNPSTSSSSHSMASRHDDEDLFDSNDDLPHSFNLNDLCRFCARPSQDMIQIFGAEGLRRELEQKINLCLPIKVDISDSLPLSLCRPCVERVEQSHEMATMCQQADLTLRRLQQRLAQEQPTDSGTTDVKFFDIKKEILEDEPRLEVDALVINQKFKCEVCKVGFDSNLEAINHCSQNHVESEEVTVKIEPSDILPETSSTSYPDPIIYCPSNQTFMCNICNTSFATEEEASTHRSQYHPDVVYDYDRPDYVCLICEESLLSKTELTNHCLQIHEKYMCYICCTLFDSFNSLASHSDHDHVISKEIALPPEIKTKTPRKYTRKNVKLTTTQEDLVNKTECKMCFKLIKNESIIIHYKLRHKKTLCPYCLDFVNNVRTVKQHCLSVHGEPLRKKPKMYVCDACGKTYNLEASFKSHVLTAHSEEKYSCSLCERKFYKKYQLRDHLLRHAGNKTKECNICRRKFFNKTAVQAHMKSHDDEQKFSCAICNTKFKSSKNLLAHTQKQHDTHWVYNCNICSEGYTNEENVLNHFNNSHKDIEKSKFKNEFYKTSPFECEICVNKFWGSKLGLQIHMRRKHGVSAKDLAQKLIKEVDQNFECHNCGKKFTTKYLLRAHIIIHLKPKGGLKQIRRVKPKIRADRKN